MDADLLSPEDVPFTVGEQVWIVGASEITSIFGSSTAAPVDRLDKVTTGNLKKLQFLDSHQLSQLQITKEVDTTFGKGKSHDAEETPVEAEETPRMFAMENGRIVFKGEEKE